MALHFIVPTQMYSIQTGFLVVTLFVLLALLILFSLTYVNYVTDANKNYFIGVMVLIVITFVIALISTSVICDRTCKYMHKVKNIQQTSAKSPSIRSSIPVNELQKKLGSY